MSIFDRKLRKKTDELTLESLREGRVPTARSIFQKLRTFLERSKDGPSFNPRYQQWRGTWDYEATNECFKEIKFDLEVANEEVVDQLTKLLRRYGFIELAYTSQKTQIETLITALRNLLFVSKNAEDSFYGIFDSFTDLSKVDTELTTQDAVDLNEGVVLLPANDLTADKVDLTYLYNRVSWPITARSVTGGSIVQNETVAQSHFGYAFADFIQSWQQLVTLDNGGGAEIEFTISMFPDPARSTSISRVAIYSSSAHDMKVTLLHSLDNVNFTRFAGIPEQVVCKPGQVTSVDFETTRLSFLRLVCRLSTPTVVDGGSYGYVFGIRNISAYTIGRTRQSVFVSKAMQPVGMERGIDKIALSVIEDIPRGCSIDYFVAAADADGNPRGDVWAGITPLNRADVDGIPKTIQLGNNQGVSVDLPNIDPTVYATVRGTEFFQLNETPLAHDVIFHSAKLYRGQGAWYRNSVRNPVIKEVRDAFIDFTSGDVQNLYAVTTEQPDISTTTKTNGSTVTSLTVSRQIDYNATTMLLIPGKSTNPETDQRPRYAVYKIQRIRDLMEVTDETVVMPSDFSWKQMGNFGIRATGTGRPLVKNSTGTVTYVEGKDYELESETAIDPNAPNVLTGRIKRLSTSTFAFGATLKVSYEVESDITYMAESITGDKVTLKKDLGTIPDQYFLVTYRFIPRPPYTIRKSNLVVSDGYGSTGKTTFQEGPDFLVDAVTGTITRVPTGKIKSPLQIYADFQYEERPPELDVFSTWVRVSTKDPVKVTFSPIGIDTDAGERMAVNDVDVSKLTEFPELSYGWHLITVRSKRPESVGNAAITNVVKLKDRENNPVFIAGGRYFSEIIATRDPMLQRSYTQLTKGTPKGDHGYFAITDDGYVVVNFEPGETEEIYSYGYRYDETATLTYSEWPEDWLLEYAYELENGDPVEKVLLKAVLQRSEGTDGGVTPKLFEYHMRLA